ncbi:MAG: hypothetical protein JWM80_908 [Cyanobacteria bacterium RYN_339]|nr:hypothetical protein [Cyanobacteria bacterium RYN_339]
MDPAAHLHALARRIADEYVGRTAPLAVMLSGSAATGKCDAYSDLDLMVYHALVPEKPVMEAARAALGGSEFREIFPWSQRGYGEQFLLGGVQCQVAHTQVQGWERDLTRVLDECEVTPQNELQKALAGTLDGIALHGDALIQGWKDRAADYPDGLARKMVKAHLKFFPLWWIHPSRVTALWRHQVLVEGAGNLMGILAGLNKQYFSTFQPKRLVDFDWAPPDFHERVDRMFSLPHAEAAALMEQLVFEVVLLVEARMPDLDTSEVRRRLGERQQPWA